MSKALEDLQVVGVSELYALARHQRLVRNDERRPWADKLDTVECVDWADVLSLVEMSSRENKIIEMLKEVIRLRLATDEGSLRVRADRIWELATHNLKALGESPSADAVDPHAASTGTPSTRV